MSELLITGTLLFYLSFFKYYKWYSPAHTYAVVTLINLAVFYVTINLGLQPGEDNIVRFSFKFANRASYLPYASEVCLLFATVTAIAILAEITASRIEKTRKSSFLLRENYLAKASSYLEHVLSFTMTLQGLTILLVFVLTLYVAIFWHAAEGGISAAAGAYLYKFMKPPENAGVSSIVGIVVHTRGDMLLILSLSVLIVTVAARNFLIALMITVPVVYLGLMELFMSSRSVALAMAVGAILSVAFFRNLARVWMVLSFGVAMVVTYGLALAGRQNGTVGAEVLFRNLTEMNFSFGELFWQIVMNPFANGSRIAYAIARGQEYPLPYQILATFSPFPDLIDNFGAWRWAMAPINGNQSMPVGAYGEFVTFSPLVILGAAVALYAALVVFGIFARRYTGVPALLVFVLTIVPISGIPGYQTRSYFRFFLIMAFITLVLMIILRRKSKGQSSADATARQGRERWPPHVSRRP